MVRAFHRTRTVYWSSGVQIFGTAPSLICGAGGEPGAGSVTKAAASSDQNEFVTLVITFSVRADQERRKGEQKEGGGHDLHVVNRSKPRRESKCVPFVFTVSRISITVSLEPSRWMSVGKEKM
jgi:hypothetical protein